MMPGNKGSPACSLRTRLSRTSCFTGREQWPDRRSSPRVWMTAIAIDSIRTRLTNDQRPTTTMHPFFASSRPLVFAHRGGSALAPENTIEAFDNGLRLGADGVELDVHLSRDAQVMVHHDRTHDRTTTLGGPIAE